MTRIHAASSTSTAARPVAVAAVFMLSLFQPAGVSAPLAELICAEPAGAVVGVTWTVRVVVHDQQAVAVQLRRKLLAG
jgi:hypothetical protein